MATETSLFKAYKMLNARDQNLVETVGNVLTSLPFIALGIQVPRRNFNAKMYSNSLIGVGVASTLYHSSRGKLRKYLRWADYTIEMVCKEIASSDLIFRYKYWTKYGYFLSVAFTAASKIGFSS
ncbi:uncharacterized protein LOC105797839 [Gossypium raimondii]|uniref:uncharacterized protein LOC105797839 n=1 Tax=Gossypium raimondii TaxID=29730 RepID=UPI00063ABACA|nr:uncharacterized protein LOC105797839 [Gossypium raimondii]